MHSAIKKILLRRLGRYFILLCAGIFSAATGWNRSGWHSDVLVIGGAVTSLVAFLSILNVLLIWHEFEKKVKEEETGILEPDSYIIWPAWFNRSAAFVIHILLFIGITFGASRHENDFGGLSFLIHSLIAGLLTGYAAFYLLALYFPSWNDHKNKRIEITFYIILITVFLFVSLGPVVNEYWTRSQAECKTFVIESGYRQRKIKENYIRVLTDKGTERFKPPKSILRRLGPEDSLLTLCIKKGGLGYEFVDEFRIP